MIAMEIIPLSIKDVLVMKSMIHEDNRGYLYESFNQDTFNKLLNTDVHFIQDVHSF